MTVFPINYYINNTTAEKQANIPSKYNKKIQNAENIQGKVGKEQPETTKNKLESSSSFLEAF